MKTFLITDAEGVLPDIIEISILVCRDHCLIDIFHEYGIPSDKQKHLKSASYCHCIPYASLCYITPNSSENLLSKAREFVSHYPSAIVISNDKSSKSDIYHLISSWYLDLEYCNIYVGDWLVRVHQQSHLESRRAKLQCKIILGISCNLHTLPLYKQKHTPSHQAKYQHGYHCSLYDTYELFLFLRNAWSTVAAAHTSTSSSA